MALDVCPVADAGTPEFAAIGALYEAAFPESERKPLALLAAATRRADQHLFHAVEAGRTVGMALVYRSAAHGFSLLEYMAVDAASRGHGLGAALFEQVQALAGAPMLLEVESEQPAVPGAALRLRRQNFYRRLGCRSVENFAYAMPQVAAAPPPPMILMVSGSTASALAGETLRCWLEDIYAQVYRRAADDPGLLRMLRGISDRLALA